MSGVRRSDDFPAGSSAPAAAPLTKLTCVLSPCKRNEIHSWTPGGVRVRAQPSVPRSRRARWRPRPAFSPLQGEAAAACAATVRSRFWPALQMNWRVWTPVQFINVNYVPLQVSGGRRHPPAFFLSPTIRVRSSPRIRRVPTPARRGPRARVHRARGPHTFSKSRGRHRARSPRGCTQVQSRLAPVTSVPHLRAGRGSQLPAPAGSSSAGGGARAAREARGRSRHRSAGTRWRARGQRPGRGSGSCLGDSASQAQTLITCPSGEGPAEV